jgi:hypothetical protein
MYVNIISDGICKKVSCIVLETVLKQDNEILVCKQFENEIQRPLNTQPQQICPECGYRLILDGSCSICMNCGMDVD